MTASAKAFPKLTNSNFVQGCDASVLYVVLGLANQTRNLIWQDNPC